MLKRELKIGLSLSGGGSRAIAFHLGCMRALHGLNVLQNVSIISAVSGGSVIAGMYGYSAEDFAEFDRRVVNLLRHGLHWSIVRNILTPRLFTLIVSTNLISRPIALAAKLLHYQPPLRRWASRTTALERALEELYGNVQLTKVVRPNLEMVFNACELRTGTAFRFGNRRSGTWRLGQVAENRISVAHAVACSAAYPFFLPAVDQDYSFIKNGATRRERVIITDGGVYDNLGISCLEPSQNENFNLHTYPSDYIICCHAGHGQFSGKSIPYGFLSRVESAFSSVFRKAQDAGLSRLHMHKESGKIKGFILPYLGQQDDALPIQLPDLIRREKVIDFPTNFAAMTEKDIQLLTGRGEQLTRILINHYCPEIK